MSNLQPVADLITAGEAERILRKSRRTVVRWAKEERLKPVTKLSGDTGAYLFERSDVEALRDELEAELAARYGEEGAA